MAEERKGIYQSLPAWLRLMRPEQWTKNGLVLAAFFFAYWDPQQHLREQGLRPYAFSIAAAALFCLVSSGVYALNDWRDRVADRLHPVKRHRPVASGEISSKTAIAMALGLLAAGIIGSLFSPQLCAVISAYVALQLLYTFRLKHVPLVDVFVIAAGSSCAPLPARRSFPLASRPGCFFAPSCSPSSSHSASGGRKR